MISYLKGIIRHQVQSSDEVFTSDELNMLRLKISVLEYLIVTDSACVTDHKGGRVKQMQTLYYKQIHTIRDERCVVELFNYFFDHITDRLTDCTFRFD